MTNFLIFFTLVLSLVNTFLIISLAVANSERMKQIATLTSVLHTAMGSQVEILNSAKSAQKKIEQIISILKQAGVKGPVH